MRLHCTKKLFGIINPASDKIVRERGPASLDSMGDWHANLITITRKKHLIFVHDKTRYCVFIPCVKKQDMKALDRLFEDVFLNSLLKLGISEQEFIRAKNMLSPFTYDHQCDRSVQGTMNRIADEIGWMVKLRAIPLDQITGYGLSAEMSHRPCTVKGEKDAFWPGKKMREVLSGKFLS